VPKKLIIGPARKRNLPALAGHDGSHLGLLHERWKRVGEGKGDLVVATLKGRPVGQIYLWRQPADEDEVRERLPGIPLLMNLWVHRNFRRRGVGRALVEYAEERLRRLGHPAVALAVEEENGYAKEFYLGLDYLDWGFGKLKTHRDEFDGNRSLSWEVCDILVKELVTSPSVGHRSPP